MNEFLLTPGRRAEQRNVHYRHILGPPASEQAIDAWLERHSTYRLPADLRALVMRVNGIHLWASVQTGRSYVGLAPIEQWEPLRVKLYLEERDPLDDRHIVISYHQDGASFVVLDVMSETYFLMDAAGPDTTSPIASNA